MVTEWTVVTVIVSLLGLIGTVAVPLSRNTKAMTSLCEQIKHLNYRMGEEEKDLEMFKAKAAERHKTIFGELDKHGEQLTDHEHRIKDLEKKY